MYKAKLIYSRDTPKVIYDSSPYSVESQEGFQEGFGVINIFLVSVAATDLAST